MSRQTDRQTTSTMFVYTQVAREALWPPLKYIAVYAQVDHTATVPMKVSREYIRHE